VRTTASPERSTRCGKRPAQNFIDGEIVSVARPCDGRVQERSIIREEDGAPIGLGQQQCAIDDGLEHAVDRRRRIQVVDRLKQNLDRTSVALKISRENRCEPPDLDVEAHRADVKVLSVRQRPRTLDSHAVHERPRLAGQILEGPFAVARRRQSAVMP